MTLLESFLISLALCVDSLVVSTSSSFKSKMALRRGLLMAVTFGFFQGLFPLLGALLGEAFRSYVEAVDHWIAFFLLLFVGGRMVWEAFHPNDEDKHLDVARFGVMCLLGIATSIDAFVVGIGFGLNNTLRDIIVTVVVIGLVTFLVSLLGWFLGKRSIPIPEKAANIIAGLVLVGLGTFTLIEHTLL